MLRGVLIVLALLTAVAMPGTGCVTWEDRCVDVVCEDGEICIDLDAAPTCVCDELHVEENGACVPVDDGEEPSGDAGP